MEGSQGDGVQRHVVLLHELRQLLPGHHLMVISELVHWDQFIPWWQRGLRSAVEWSVGVQRRAVGGCRGRSGHW